MNILQHRRFLATLTGLSLSLALSRISTSTNAHIRRPPTAGGPSRAPHEHEVCSRHPSRTGGLEVCTATRATRQPPLATRHGTSTREYETRHHILLFRCAVPVPEARSGQREAHPPTYRACIALRRASIAIFVMSSTDPLNDCLQPPTVPPSHQQSPAYTVGMS